MSNAVTEDFSDLQAQVKYLSEQLRALQGHVELENESENPIYELLAPFMSPDDIYYPEGARFEDVTGGLIPPNEFMEPKNAAAERCMRAWLRTLPSAQKTPAFENIIEAAMQVRPKEGDDAQSMAEYQGKILQRALELQYQKQGILPKDMPEPENLKSPQRIGNVPVMANTRISGQSSFKAPAKTKLRADPVSAADKAAPAIATSRSELLGRQSGIGVLS